tara:strand:- start:1850 stop:2131 length:282 start_codon:yes stop_codon:yes gene_type:complete
MANHYLDGVLLKKAPLGFTEPTEEEAKAQNTAIKEEIQRQDRDILLAKSDWTQANDSPLSNEKKIEWATYRTALRDLPSNKSWPDVTFPEEPS